MKTDTELLWDALKIIEHKTVLADWRNQVIEKIKSRLAETEPEPVAWIADSPTLGNGPKVFFNPLAAKCYAEDVNPLYRHPPRPVRLSDEEIRRVFLSNGFTIKHGHNDLKPYVFNAARAIEKAMLEKSR